MNPFLRYLADKNSAHTHTHTHTDRHTPMTTRPCGLRRAGNQCHTRWGRTQGLRKSIWSIKSLLSWLWVSSKLWDLGLS